MPRYISCSAKLVCLVSELFSSAGQFCFVSSSCGAQCRAPVICPPSPPVTVVCSRRSINSALGRAGRGVGGKRAGNSQCSKSRCRPWLNTRAGSAARPGTPANYLPSRAVTALLWPMCHPVALSCVTELPCVMCHVSCVMCQETWTNQAWDTG